MQANLGLDPVSSLQLFSLRYIEDYAEYYCLVADSVHTTDTRQDETRQFWIFYYITQTLK